MINKVKAWLANPKREYAEGLAYFLEHASADIRIKFANFLSLKEGEEKVDQFDSRFSILINKVVMIAHKMELDPAKYTEAVSVELFPLKKLTEQASVIRGLKETNDSLQEQVEELEAEGEGHEDEISELNSTIEENTSKIEELETKVLELSESTGIKIVKETELPDGLKKKYERVKAIVPLMAKIHAELSAADTDEKRKELAEELCKLDDEKRSIWDAIDAWAENGNKVLDESKDIVYSEDLVVAGAQMSKRIERLKENIKRSEESITKHTEAGKANLIEKATVRLNAYTKELAELEAKIGGEKKEE